MLDKTNANAIHAAMRLPVEVSTLDFGGALRSGVGALRAAINGGGSTLVVVADQRDGLPGGADEGFGGDSAAALLVGDDSPGAPVIAELIGSASASDEFIDRWRTPGERRSKMWEERFGETRYLPLGKRCLGPGPEVGRGRGRPGEPRRRHFDARSGRQSDRRPSSERPRKHCATT